MDGEEDVTARSIEPEYRGVNHFGNAVFRFHAIDELGVDHFPYIEFDRDQLLTLQGGVLNALTDRKLGKHFPGDES